MCCTTSVPAIERPERDFCSGQCRERFEANPGLYVGVPTQQAPRQQGKWVLKRRSFALEVPLSTEQVRLLTALSLLLLLLLTAGYAGLAGKRSGGPDHRR